MGVFIVESGTLADRLWEPDATLSQQVDEGWDVTDVEVEDGADINDHIRKRLVTTTMRLVVTDTPTTDSPVTAEGGSDRANEVIDRLRELAGIELDIFTEGREPLRGFVLTGMPRQYPRDRSIIINASFKEYRVVGPAWTDAAVIRSGGLSGSPGGDNAGPFAPEGNDGQGSTEPTESTLYRGLTGGIDAVVGFGGF